MKRLLFTATVAVLAFASPGYSQVDNWEVISEGSTGTIWLMRRADISNQVNFFPRVWVMLDHSRDSTKSQRSTKMLIDFNCTAQTYQTLSSVKYRPNGSAVDSWLDRASQYRHDYVTPGSVMEDALKHACPTESSR